MQSHDIEKDCNLQKPKIDVGAFLADIVEGANILAAGAGGKKRRRRVPTKQEKLVRLVAEKGTATFSDLSQTFSREWKTVEGRHKGEYILVPKQEFFRNMADLVGRINQAVLAAFEGNNSSVGSSRQPIEQRVLMDFDQQAMTISWVPYTTDSNPQKPVRTTQGGGHVPYRQPDNPVKPNTVVEPVAAPPPPPLPTPPKQVASAQTPTTPPTPAPPSIVGRTEVLEVSIDPTTLYWSMTIGAHKCEIMPDLGYVKVNSRLIPYPPIQGLKDPTELDVGIINGIIKITEAQEF